MPDSDAIRVVAFDDEPTPCSSAKPGLRPSDRPHPESSRYPLADPIALVAGDSDPESGPVVAPRSGGLQPALAVDVGLFDPHANSFLVVYPAGTPLEALEPRTIAVPAPDAGSPTARLTLCVRAPGDPQPAPYLTFEWPQPVPGQRVTLRFAVPADLRSFVVHCDPSPRLEFPGTVLLPLRSSNDF